MIATNAPNAHSQAYWDSASTRRLRRTCVALAATTLAILAAPCASIAAQGDNVPGARHIRLAPKPDKQQIAAALDHVKTTILPHCWDAKCSDSESRRRKYLKKWQAVVSDHYVVFTNGPTSTCKKYAVTLESLYDKMQKQLPFEDPDHLLVAYIFKDKDSYFRYASNVTGYSEKGARATAGHATSEFYATYFTSPRSAVVYHEAAHEIVGACLKVRGVGSWFQEGMAVYFEKKMVNQKLEGCRGEIKRGDSYPLGEFFAIQTLLSDPNGHGRRNYSHAGALLNFMIETKVAPIAGNFDKFLHAARTYGHGYARGKDVSAKLIQKVYGLTVAEFEQAWRKHLKIRR
ncbi:MAG: hypothetical protein AB8H80_07110 [Planctomycetota bacterium]